MLYHYTTQSGFLGIVRSRSIWATHHQCLNDSQEFLHAKELLRREIEKRGDDMLLQEMGRTLSGTGFEDVNMYVASLSEDSDSLAQWRAYGGPGSGLCLGFNQAELVLPERFVLVPCIYDGAAQTEKVRFAVDYIAQRAVGRTGGIEVLTRMELHEFALTLKHPKFADEKEWRIISDGPLMEDPPETGDAPLAFREGKSCLVPYRCVPLRNNA
jgi:hypothetical protein